MIFLPTEVPYELSRDMFAASARSMRLYVKRVFINDKFEDLVRPRIITMLIYLSGMRSSFAFQSYLLCYRLLLSHVVTNHPDSEMAPLR